MGIKVCWRLPLEVAGRLVNFLLQNNEMAWNYYSLLCQNSVITPICCRLLIILVFQCVFDLPWVTFRKPESNSIYFETLCTAAHCGSSVNRRDLVSTQTSYSFWKQLYFGVLMRPKPLWKSVFLVTGWDQQGLKNLLSTFLYPFLKPC